MGVKDWGVPLLVAAVTFGGLYALQPHLGAGKQEAPDAGIDHSGFTYPFPDAPRVADANASATVLLLSRDAQPVGGEWRTPHVAFQDSIGDFFDCANPTPCNLTHEVAVVGEPRLGVAGYNATRVTAHIFDEQGVLLFSNAPAGDRERFNQGVGSTNLPNGTWYLGAEATPPNGTVRLPPAAAAVLDRLRPLLVGLPEGGVASVQTNALVSLYGTLFVTVRIDELVHAP